MNDGLILAAHFIDVLTCGNLDYCEPQHGHSNRAIAGADLVNNDHVFSTDVPGEYMVRARFLKVKKTGKPVYYRVKVGDDLDCECADFRNRHGKTEMLCQHVISAAIVEAMRRTWEGERKE